MLCRCGGDLPSYWARAKQSCCNFLKFIYKKFQIMQLKQESQFGLVSSIMRSKIMVFVKLLLQILLLLIFLQFFGLPAISKYHQKDVMIVESTKDTEGIPLPAISLMFAASAPEIQKYRSCYQLNVSIIDCLETNAPNVSTILKKTLFGYKKKKTLYLSKKNTIGDGGSTAL